MNYRCEVHFTDEDKGKVAIAVCHHCGKPLCQSVKLPQLLSNKKTTNKELCGYVIDDPLFFSSTGQPKVEAYHCESCLIEHHKEFIQHLQRLKSIL